MDSGCYMATVKVEVETSATKTKMRTENYIVMAGSTKAASEKIMEYMKSNTSEWRLVAVKEMNIAAIIDENCEEIRGFDNV